MKPLLSKVDGKPYQGAEHDLKLFIEKTLENRFKQEREIKNNIECEIIRLYDLFTEEEIQTIVQDILFQVKIDKS